jgi:hypothetical protein
MFGKAKPTVVVSEPDLQAALAHLRSLPYRANAPASWDRKHVLDVIREATGSAPKIGDCVQVGPGVYGIVKPFGIDLVGGPYAEGRLQILIAIRSAGTDPENVVEL